MTGESLPGERLRCLVVGLGVQGVKRRRIAGDEAVASVDPDRAEAGYRAVEQVPLADYDAALVCTPDQPKLATLEYLLGQGKHVLVEKPLLLLDRDLVRLETLARSHGAVCYTAYNHRFEPHFARLKRVISSGELGRLYRCRLFYGNGTAREVRQSAWRDQGAGVLPDLGSHLLDAVAFWFGRAHLENADAFRLVSCDRFENRAPDHVVIACGSSWPRLELEMSLVSWRNDFSCDLIAERGSVHLRSLCKWGPASFTLRRRVLPSGRPPEETETLVQEDPTWAAEYEHFKKLCRTRAPADLGTDRWLGRVLDRLSAQTRSGGGHAPPADATGEGVP